MLNNSLMGFSGSSGKEFTCQCRGHRFDSRSGKIPPAAEQLSPCTTIEPVLQSQGTANTKASALQSPCSSSGEATAMRNLHTAMKQAPACYNQRKTHSAAKSQWSQNNNNNNNSVSFPIVSPPLFSPEEKHYVDSVSEQLMFILRKIPHYSL